jgi:hypothetical protein
MDLNGRTANQRRDQALSGKRGMEDSGDLGHLPRMGNRLVCEPWRQDFLEALAEAV